MKDCKGINCSAASEEDHSLECIAEHEAIVHRGAVKALMKKREKNAIKIDELKSENRKLIVEMCQIEGPCPRCKNWHYPHC